MDAALFTKMLSDKNVLDLRKLGYKFPQADIKTVSIIRCRSRISPGRTSSI